MSLAEQPAVQLRHLDRFFIDGEWVVPSSDATITVTDSATEERFFSVAEAQAADIDRAVDAARRAFDAGPWPRMSHAQRAEYLRAIADACAQARRRSRRHLAARIRRAARTRPACRRGCGAEGSEYYAGAGGHVPVRGGGAADRRWRVRAARARAGRRRRRDHPLERADAA